MDAPCMIRNATLDDLAAVNEIERASFADPWRAADFRAALGATLFLVAVRHDAVAGYVIARQAADEGELLNLAVAPGERGRGVGSALAVCAIGALRDQGVGAVYLEVRESNAAARRLYGRLGFAPVARRARYYRDPPEDALVLKAAIPAVGGDAIL